jgi:hypothetical protein
MKKGVASIGLVAALAIVGAVASGKPAVAIGVSGAFVDDDGSLHEPDINAIAAVGITAGCGPSIYCPSALVTRAEMATFLARALELTPLDTGSFNDTSASIHARNINAIAAEGITSGCSSTAFCPNQAVTREEMASLLARALDLPEGTGTPFSDVSGSAHVADISAIATAGITAGCAASLYCPYNPVTRAQMATFLTRGFGLQRIYPQIPMIEGVSLSCSKDGLTCQGSVTVPYRSMYEFREGFYDTIAGGGLASGSTRVELTINGFSVSVSPLPIGTSSNRPSRLYWTTFTLAPGTHTFVAHWYWNGYLEQTTTVYVTVRT